MQWHRAGLADRFLYIDFSIEHGIYAKLIFLRLKHLCHFVLHLGRAVVEMTVPQQRRKWWQLQWFADSDTKEERRLILKLDFLIVPYAFLAYWTKYIDQANISMD
jgi:hypothetical protein